MSKANCLAAMFLSAGVLFTCAVDAMEIRQFDKMAGQDQDDYVQVLVDGAQKRLLDQGQIEQAGKVRRLFTVVPSGGKTSLGMEQFKKNLALARWMDAKNAEKNPHAPRLEVEYAMAMTLKQNGIELPDKFSTVASKFKPKLELKEGKKEGSED